MDSEEWTESKYTTNSTLGGKAAVKNAGGCCHPAAVSVVKAVREVLKLHAAPKIVLFSVLPPMSTTSSFYKMDSSY